MEQGIVKNVAVNEDLAPLLELAGRVGRNPLLTQASTGNISLKLDGVLWVKASGKWLADAAGGKILIKEQDVPNMGTFSLVSDPDGFHTELTSDLRTLEGKLDVWLLQGSERFASDPEIAEVLLKAARQKDTRKCILLLGAVVDTPGLADRLLEALRPQTGGDGRTVKKDWG